MQILKHLDPWRYEIRPFLVVLFYIMYVCIYMTLEILTNDMDVDFLEYISKKKKKKKNWSLV